LQSSDAFILKLMTLGEKLRQAREERDISISEVAEHTRISPLYLQAIENDEFKTLPGGIFNKGFIKSFAKYVGIDENEAMQDYAKQFSQQNDGDDSDDPKTYKPEVLTDDRAGGSMFPTIIIAVLILGLMTWGVLSLVNYIQNQPGQPVANTNTNTNSNTANVTTANTNAADPIPSTDEIKVELKTQNDPVSVSYRTDGKAGNKLMTADEPLILEGQENVKIGFAKTLSKDVQMTLNGKEIKLPSEPENPKRIPIEVEINKENIKRILTDGEYKYDETPSP
jgi:cytoskeletal protein RodZ